MSARDDAERYAMDLMVEVRWDDDAMDDELARKTLTLKANGDPKEIVPRLKLTFKVVRAAERLAAAREPYLARRREGQRGWQIGLGAGRWPADGSSPDRRIPGRPPGRRRVEMPAAPAAQFPCSFGDGGMGMGCRRRTRASALARQGRWRGRREAAGRPTAFTGRAIARLGPRALAQPYPGTTPPSDRGGT